MAGFGEDLRLAREGLGVGLGDLSSETKINLRHLEALERGDFHELPGGVFRRGIVRSYVHALGLDESDWLSRFERSLQDHATSRGESLVPKEEAWVAFATNVRKSRKRQRPETGWRWAGVGLLLFALLSAAWTVWRFELLRVLER